MDRFGKALRLTMVVALLATFNIGALVSLAGAVSTDTVGIAASFFVGGPLENDYPRYVPNDHTPFALRFTVADGELAANTQYYLKIRLTVDETPSGATNRGFTWNPVTSHWVQEREPWTEFPQVTTNENGGIAQSDWMFAKFGDTRVTGTRHILISLAQSGTADTFNCLAPPTVTLLDMTYDGAWVHNGLTTGKGDVRRVAVAESGETTPALALTRSEINTVDDDSDGVVDDEDHGPAGASGDFWFGVPAGEDQTVIFQQSPYKTYTSGPEDTDMAVGAEDTTAPAAVVNLVADTGHKSAELSWDASTDNTGVVGYHIYRWQDAPLGSAYTPVKTHIADAAGTSYTDTGLTVGDTYYYEVRAFDAATNVGPRSNTASMIAEDQMAPAAISDLTAAVQSIDSVLLEWTAPGDDGSVGQAKEYFIRYSTSPIGGEAAWSAATAVSAVPVPGAAGAQESFGIGDLEAGTTYYFAVKTSDDVGNVSAISNIAEATPQGAGETVRTAGATRYETAVEISRRTFATASTVVLATGTNFADAVVASGVAGAVDGPVLLTGAALPQSVLDEIRRLGAKHVVIMGGTGAVPAAVEQALVGAGLTTERVAGATRYSTAAAAAAKIAALGFDTSKVFIARGDEFPDSLAVSPYACTQVMPVLLVTPDAIPADTQAALSARGVTDAVVAGGTGAVGAQVFGQIDAILTGSVVRVAGADRTATAAALGDYAVSRGWASYAQVGLATGYVFADALTGGTATGFKGGVMLLTAATTLSAPTEAALRTHAVEIDEVEVFGGIGAISTDVMAAIVAAVGD